MLPREMGGAHVEGMPNIRGMLYVLLHLRISPWALLGLTLAFTAALLLLLAFAAHRQPASSLLLPFIITVTLLTSYYCYMFDLSLLMLGFVLVARYVMKRDLVPKRWAMLLTVAYFYVVPFFSPSLERMMVYFFFGVLALTAELFLEIADPQRDPVRLPRPILAGPAES